MSIAQHYSSLGDDELRHIASRMEHLTDEAKLALSAELGRRNINDIEEYAIQMSAEERALQIHKGEKLAQKIRGVNFYARIGYTICLVMFAFGVVMYLTELNPQNGIGVMAGSAVCLLIIWLSAVLRKFIWRIVLRA